MLKVGDRVRCIFTSKAGESTFGKIGTIKQVKTGLCPITVEWDDGSALDTTWEKESSFEVLPKIIGTGSGGMPHHGDVCHNCQHIWGDHYGTKCPTTGTSQWKFIRVSNTSAQNCGNTTDEKPELGDTVQVSIEMSDGIIAIREATYLGIHDRFDTIYFKEELRGRTKYNISGTDTDVFAGSWVAKNRAQILADRAIELGLDPNAPNCWLVSGYQSKITKVLKRKGKDKEMPPTTPIGNVDHKVLKPGDRVLVQLKDQNGFTYDAKATVIFYDPSYYETHIYFDDPISFPNTVGNSWMSSSISGHLVTRTKELGLDTNQPNCFKVGDSVNGSNNIKYARFTQILSRAADKVSDKEKGKDKNMSTTNKTEVLGFMETLKADAEKGVWRAGATTLADGAQAGILLAMKANMDLEDSKMEVVAELLKTKGGNALIRSVLGYVLTYGPGIKDLDPRVAKLAEEFRVSGMQVGMEGIMSMLQQYLAPALMQTLGNLPPIQEVVPAEVRHAVRRTRKRVAHADKARIASAPTPEPETLSAQEDSPETKQQAASV